MRHEIAAIPRAVQAEFARRYQAWRKTWDSPSIAFRSDTAAVRHSQEFAALVALGPQVLPLLVEKIARPEVFLALQAFQVLRAETAPNIVAAPDNGQRLESEQAKARRAVKDWFAR